MITNPSPQRALRGHRPARPATRIATTGAHHAQLASHLTARDRWLARMLWEHRVFTTHQLVELAWTNTRTANARLRALYLWRVLDRFQPFITTGTAPMHYVLDIAGAVALAYEVGHDPKTLGYRHDTAIGIAHSLRLAHTVGINGWFTALIDRSRRQPDHGQLTAWWSEARCARLFGDLVRPDAYGRWRDHDRDVEFFLEFDFGTEQLSVLAAKLLDYQNLATATGIITPLLVWLPTGRREATARRALAEAHTALSRPDLVPLATSAADYDTEAFADPATDRWLPIPSLQHGGRRLTLTEFGARWPYIRTAARPDPSTAVAASPSHLDAPHPLPPKPAPAFRGDRQ